MSTGPTTPEGKAVVSRNAIRHGLRAQAIVIPSEAQTDWETHAEAVVSSCTPETPLEHALAVRVAELIWRLRRVSRAERDAVTDRHEHFARIDQREAATGRIIQQRAWPVMPEEVVLAPILRYEAHLNRQLLQTLHELEALRDRRAGHPAPLARVEVLGLPAE
jgi:hypothetical protein